MPMPNNRWLARVLEVLNDLAGGTISVATTPSTVVATSVAYADSPNLDAFARLRVSEPTGLFDAQMQYDTSPLYWESVATGGATVTHLPNESAVQLQVSAGESVIRQSREFFYYQPGKSQLVFLTFGLGGIESDVTKRVGYFETSNGIYLEVSDALYMVRRYNTTGVVQNERVAQSNWNLDTLDGSGPSGITIDISKAQILIVDLEWLGVGRVRVGFVIDGIPVYCHEFLHANNTLTTYTTTANLPLRYELIGGAGLVGTATFKQICCMVASEGGFEIESGVPISTSNGATTISVTTRRPILSIRPRLTFNSIVNRIPIVPERIDLYSQDQSIFWELVYGGTLTGPAFANVNAAASSVERDVAASAISGGIVINSGYVAAGTGGPFQATGAAATSILSKLPLFLDVSGAHPATPYTDILSLVATSIPGTATAISGSLTWLEIR